MRLINTFNLLELNIVVPTFPTEMKIWLLLPTAVQIRILSVKLASILIGIIVGYIISLFAGMVDFTPG